MSPLPTYLELGIDAEGSRKAARCRCARWNKLSCFHRINQISQAVKISTIFLGLRVGPCTQCHTQPSDQCDKTRCTLPSKQSIIDSREF